MFARVLVTGKNEETLLPRVLRLFSKQGAQVESLHLEAREDVLHMEFKLTEAAATQLAKLLAKQVSVLSVKTAA